MDPTLAYVAVVTTAIMLPLGVHLGALRERARAELRRPQSAHEALARVYELPTPREIVGVLRGPLPSRPDPSLTERVPRGPA